VRADVERFEELAVLEPVGRRHRDPRDRRRRVDRGEVDRTDLGGAGRYRSRRRHCRGRDHRVPVVVATPSLVSVDASERVLHNKRHSSKAKGGMR